MKTKIISVLNLKGGVGKTTTTLNLAKAIANAGKKVLIIDLDYQCNLSISLGIINAKFSIYDLLFNDCFLDECISNKELDIIPSHINLHNFDLKNGNKLQRELILKKKLRKLKELEYDYVFIDNAPATNLLVMNALAISDYILIPVKLAPLGLYGTTQLLNFISEIKEGLNPKLQILGILGTFYDNTNKSKECFNTLKKECSEVGVKVFDTFIRQNVKLKEAPDFGKSIFEYCPKCHGAEDYLKLSKEIMEKL